MRRLIAIVALALVAATCADDDQPAAAPTTSSPSTTVPTTTSPPTTSTTTTSIAPAPETPLDWPVVDVAFELDSELLPALLEPGAEPHTALRYGGTGTREWGLGLWGRDAEAPTTFLGTAWANADGVVIELDRFLDEPIDEPAAIGLDAWGRPTLRTPDGSIPAAPTVAETTAFTLPRFVVFPDEPVGIGARWSPPASGPDTFYPAPEYELVSVEGPVVTVRAAGTVDGIDITEPGALRNQNAPSTASFSGLVSVDLRTGIVIAQTEVEGTTETTDGPVEWTREVATEPAVIVDDSGMPVALTLQGMSDTSGSPVSNTATTFLGVTTGTEEGHALANFAGVAGPASVARFAAGPEFFDGTDSWPPGLYASTVDGWFDSVMPAFLDDPDLRAPLTFDGLDSLYILDVGIGGTTVPVTWEIAEFLGGDIVVRVDATFDQEDIHRGYAFRPVGTAVGEFRVNRFNLLDIEGRLDVEFDVIDANGRSARLQTWVAERAPVPPGDDWVRESDGVERVAEVAGRIPPDEEHWFAPFGYGGASWDGTVEIEQFWSRLDREDAPTTIRSTLDIESRLAPDGQWLLVDVESWDATGPRFDTAAAPDTGDGEPFALTIDPRGRIGDARPADGDAFTAVNERNHFGRLWLQALPYFPEDPLEPELRWTVRLASEEPGTGLTYRVVDVVDGQLLLDVFGTTGMYIGDRYDGWTISAEVEGTMTIDWAAGVPIEVDIEATGTSTYGVAGVPDPSTAEPWRSSLTIRATESE